MYPRMKQARQPPSRSCHVKGGISMPQLLAQEEQQVSASSVSSELKLILLDAVVPRREDPMSTSRRSVILENMFFIMELVAGSI